MFDRQFICDEDVKKVAKYYNIPIVLETDEKIVLLTGCHNYDPYKGSKKLYYYKKSKNFVCFTRCNCSFDIISFIQKRLTMERKNASFLSALNVLKKIIGTSKYEANKDEILSKKNNWEYSLKRYIKRENELPANKIFNKELLDNFPLYEPLSWQSEGIQHNSFVKYRIGLYERFGQITIPCFNTLGELIGVRVRNTQKDLAKKAKYTALTLIDGTTYSFITNTAFYGLNYNKPQIEYQREVILVEGEKSVLKADTWWGNNSNVIALYGSSLGKIRANYLLSLGVQKVVLALDSDFHEPTSKDTEFLLFVKKTKHLASLFKGLCAVEVVYNNIGLNAYKCSPFDFSESVFRELYKHKKTL